MRKGKADYYKAGDWNAVCDVCGFKYKASELRRRWDNLMVCDEDFEHRHPQDFLKAKRDDQSVPWSRPEQVDNFRAWPGDAVADPDTVGWITYGGPSLWDDVNSVFTWDGSAYTVTAAGSPVLVPAGTWSVNYWPLSIRIHLQTSAVPTMDLYRNASILLASADPLGNGTEYVLNYNAQFDIQTLEFSLQLGDVITKIEFKDYPEPVKYLGTQWWGSGSGGLGSMGSNGTWDRENGVYVITATAAASVARATAILNWYTGFRPTHISVTVESSVSTFTVHVQDLSGRFYSNASVVSGTVYPISFTLRNMDIWAVEFYGLQAGDKITKIEFLEL